MITDVLIKTMRQIYRSKARLILIVLPPIIFMGFFGFVFGADSGNIPTTIGFINDDTGYTSDYYQYLPYNLSDNPQSLGSLFIDVLENDTSLLTNAFEDSYYELDVRIYSDEAEMIKDLEIQSIILGVKIPQNFTETILAIYNTQYFQVNGEYLDLPTDGGNTSKV